MAPVRHIVVMGVAGCGKTTVAALLAERLGWPSAEADEFHPPANIAKMSAGEPLTDDDRWPWLRAIRDWIAAHGDAGASTVVTCSALRRSYRDVLRGAGPVTFVHLSGDAEMIGARISERAHHFMPASLLPSQFTTLEPLEADEEGITASIAGTPAAIADAIIETLRLQASQPAPGQDRSAPPERRAGTTKAGDLPAATTPHPPHRTGLGTG